MGGVACRPRSQMKLRDATLFLASCGLALVLAEGFVRAFVVVRDVGPSFTAYDPYYGKWLKPDFSAERITPEFRMRLTTNALGFRGPALAALPPDPLLFLGDSFTLGYGVNDGLEYPARVANELRRGGGLRAPSVINAGLGDSGNGRWIKFLRRHADGLRPRLVVLQVLENDFADNLQERLFELTPDGGLHELPVPPQGPLRRIQAVVEAVPGLSRSYLLGLGRQINWSRAPQQAAAVPSDASGAAADAGDLLTYRLVGEAVDIGAQRGWPMLGLLVGLAPDRRRKLEAEFTRRGVAVIALPGKSERPDLYFTVDGHWNERGHAQAAAEVLRAIEALKIDVGR